MVTMAEPLITGFESMDWLVLRSTGQRFITSDGPMGFIPLPGAPPIFGELTPNVQKFISLSPATCLMMTDRAGDQPTLAVRNVDTSRVREINLRIAAASTRLVIASQLDDLDDVLATTPLTPVLDEPRATIIEWFDPTLNRSFVISIRVQADAVFPLPLSLPWECRGCGNCATAEFIVANLSKAQNPRALSEWLNTPCRKCQKSPRVTGSRFTANTINMSPGAHVK